MTLNKEINWTLEEENANLEWKDEKTETIEINYKNLLENYKMRWQQQHGNPKQEWKHETKIEQA
ncbi:24527_t:CDS:2 [Gigaspora rosea]|nr:24527_t:CDS:2 [Gigaspora rosea]